MKIRSVRCDDAMGRFEVRVSDMSMDFPYREADPPPTPENPVRDVFVDRELGRQAITFVLESGARGTVHFKQILDHWRGWSGLGDRHLELLFREESFLLRLREEVADLFVAGGMWLGTKLLILTIVWLFVPAKVFYDSTGYHEQEFAAAEVRVVVLRTSRLAGELAVRRTSGDRIRLRGKARYSVVGERKPRIVAFIRGLASVETAFDSVTAHGLLRICSREYIRPHHAMVFDVLSIEVPDGIELRVDSVSIGELEVRPPSESSCS